MLLKLGLFGRPISHTVPFLQGSLFPSFINRSHIPAFEGFLAAFPDSFLPENSLSELRVNFIAVTGRPNLYRI